MFDEYGNPIGLPTANVMTEPGNLRPPMAPLPPGQDSQGIIPPFDPYITQGLRGSNNVPPGPMQQMQPMQGMSVIQPRPPAVQMNMSPMASLGVGQLDTGMGPYATPGSVADTSMQAMKTLGVKPIEGGGGPNMGGLMTGAPVGPAAAAAAAPAAAAAAPVADAAKNVGGMGLEQAGMAASGILGVAGGITDIVVGHKQMKEAQDQQVKQQHEIDKLKSSQPSLSTPAEYYERVKNAYDTRLMQMRTEDINRNLANTTAAATSFGSRGLGALAGATSAANRAQRTEVA